MGFVKGAIITAAAAALIVKLPSRYTKRVVPPFVFNFVKPRWDKMEKAFR